MAYLHGVEVIEQTTGPLSIATAASSVIGIVGLSDTADANELILVSSDNDLAQFGDPIPGNTLALTLRAIFQNGGATCLVVNSYAAGDHLTQVTNEDVTADDQTYKGVNPFVSAIVVKDSTGATTYTLTTDYTIEDYTVKRVSTGSIVDGAALKISYKYIDITQVVDAEIIGSSTAPRTGLHLFDEAIATFGFSPKILIAPFFSSDKDVADAMITKAGTLKAVSLIDGQDVSVATAITHRGDATKAHGTNSQRAILCYPNVLTNLPLWTVTDYEVPYSMYLAGVMAASDNNTARGYWYPPSNVSVLGLSGISRVITWDPSSTSTDANALNAVGISTIVSGFGTGYLSWGQRNASYPTSSLPTNFINVRRTADIIELSVVSASAQFLGQPISGGLIDAIRETVNQFLRTLISRGAVIEGSKCEFRAVDNPPVQIAAGQLVFKITMMVGPGLERLTYDVFIDTNLLSNLTV